VSGKGRIDYLRSRHQGNPHVNRPKYRAFLSYSHRDSRWAGWLHRSIESYRPPRNLVGMESAHGVIPKRLSPVFRDREELASATDLGTVINEALSESACQIVICSPQAAKSKMGQRGDPRVQAARPGKPDLLSDHRRRAERYGPPGASG
jgi:MTH538 TIR-like domain (DUF1863)